MMKMIMQGTMVQIMDDTEEVRYSVLKEMSVQLGRERHPELPKESMSP